MKKQIFILFIIFTLLALTNGQEILDLSLSSNARISLQPSSPLIYKIKVPTDAALKDNLYIHAQPIIADPFQVPYLMITSDNGYSLNCYKAHSQFAGVCMIPTAELKNSRQFILQIKCATLCNLNLQTYLDKILNLDLNQQLKLNAVNEEGLTVSISVQIPKDSEYTALAVMAVMTNIQQNVEQVEEGIDLLLNYGGKDVATPNDEKYLARGQSLFAGGKALFLLKDVSPPGSWIKIYLKLKKGTSVSFSITKLNGNQFDITLGRSYFDFASKSQEKIYTLRTKEYTNLLQQKSIELVFDIYSGQPSITIGFDSNFTQKIQLPQQSSALSYSISPQVRSKYNFKENIYFKVKSSSAAQYYFYTQLIRDYAQYIQPSITYFDQLSNSTVQNYIMIQRFVVDANQTDIIKHYNFKVQISQGSGRFLFKRCRTIESNLNFTYFSLQQCLINSPQELTTNEFYADEIQNKHIKTDNKITIDMEYNISLCQNIQSKNNKLYYECAFQIIAVSDTVQDFAFSITAQRKYYLNYLKQSRIVKEYINKDSYLYFAFSLPNIQNVDQINIFITTFSGDTALIASTVQKMPTLDSKKENIFKETGEKASIVLRGKDIKKDVFISVYAYQFTQINLGVVVHRKNQGKETQLILEPNSVFTYLLESNEKAVYFKINSNSSTTLIVSITQLLGHSFFKILDLKGNALPCIGKTDNALVCQVQTKENTDYRIEVKGQANKQIKFAISYKTNSLTCTAGVLNLPQYVTLHKQDKQCYSFSVNRELTIKFVASFTHSQLLGKDIKTTLFIKDRQFRKIQGTHDDITLADMNNVCPLGLKREGFVSTCPIRIQFTSDANKTNYFNFIMEEEDAEIALFDGITQKINTPNIENGDPKNYYYRVYSTESIQIFFTTKSLRFSYFLAGKFVTKDAFLSRHASDESIYPKYIQQADRLKKDDLRDNLYTTTLGKSGTSIITIGSQYIKKYCSKDLDCYFILSVYADSINAQQQRVELQSIYYQIQLSQEETTLELGDSKIGFVEKGQIYTYIIDPEDAIVSIRNMNSDGKGSSVCATITSALKNGTVVNGKQLGNSLKFKKSDKIQKIFVRGDIQKCTYQISYTSSTQAVRNVRLSNPYDVKLQNGQSLGFLYYHQNPASFKIIQMISAGSADIYVMPIKSNNITLAEVLATDYKSFPIIDKVDGDFVISSSDQANFCSECFYYIHLLANPMFVGEIVFIRIHDAVPLTVNHMFKEWLLPRTQLSSESYVFYSLTDFNITFNMISGSISVLITSPDGTKVFNEEISKKRVFSVKAMNYKQSQKVQFHSLRTEYKIKVQVIEQAEYYIKVDRIHNSQRIFEGLPTTISIYKLMPTVIEFINSQDITKPLTLMTDVIEKAGSDQAILTFNLTGELASGGLVAYNDLFIKSTKADNTYVTNLKNIKGTYYITINTNVDVDITMLLLKNSLTHISPVSNHFFNSQGIFQLWTDNNNMVVQIFNCKGDLNVLASKDYKDMNTTLDKMTSSVELKRPNYGGHYVFSVQDIFGSYFLKISNKVPTNQLEYLINYYNYGNINPYDRLDATNYEVHYQIQQNGIQIKVSPPYLDTNVENDIAVKKINYWAYASANQDSLFRYSRCAIEEPAIEGYSKDNPIITIENSQIKKIIGANNTQKIYVNVQASVEIQIISPDKKIPNAIKILTILYNPIEVPIVGLQFKEAVVVNLLIFLGWMLLPFVLAAATLFYAFRYLLGRLLRDQTNMVEQVQIVASNPTIPSSNKLAEGIVYPDSAAQQIKQHI